MSVKFVFKSWDIWVAIVCASIVFFLLPSRIDSNFAKDSYFAGLSVLSVIFAIFFASLAIIMSSSHDEFISFLEEKDGYTKIIGTFRYTLMLLFIALLLSLVLYVYTSYTISPTSLVQSKWAFTIFTFISLYALFAVIMSTSEVINYSKYRAIFLRINKSGE